MAAAASATLTPIKIATPHPADAPFDHDKFVALVTTSGTKYLVDRGMLMTVSNLARTLLETASNEEAIPLENPHCTESSVAHFATWINHHAEPMSIMTRITYPLPTGDLPVIFPSWDLQFIHEHLVPQGNMLNHKELYMLAGLSVYLGVTTLQEMCCAYFAWHIRSVTEKAKESGAPTVTAAVRKWFNLDGDFTEDEMKDLVEKFRWCREVDYNQLEKDCDDAHERVLKRRADGSSGAAAQSVAA